LCFPFKEDWDRAPIDHEMKRLRKKEENSHRSTWLSQITEE